MKWLLFVLCLVPSLARADDACGTADCEVVSDLSALLGKVLAAARPTASQLKARSDLFPTCYDDGAICPGGCDPHVVTNPSENGTARVHAADSTAGNWKDCKVGEDCVICIGNDPDQCFTTTFEGSGPESGRADFTAAFWEKACQDVDALPKRMKSECTGWISTAKKHEAKVSCIHNPSYPGCEGKVPNEKAVAVAQARLADCLEARKGTSNEWRCHYQGSGGRLSQGSCPSGLLNSSRWDCCTGNPFHDACVTGCGSYYVDAVEGSTPAVDTSVFGAPDNAPTLTAFDPADFVIPDTGSPTQGSTHLLQRGDDNDAVRELQQLLVDAGYLLDTDGDFGGGTQKAVKRFQSDYGLEVDGIVHTDTWAALRTAD